MVQTQNTTQKSRQEAPGDRADRLASDGYRLQRGGGGIYLVTRPDGSRTYRIDMTTRRCNCQSTTVCKHILFCDWHHARDRAASDLADARRRDVLVSECESALWAAEECLRRVVGTGAVVVTTERRQVAA